MNRANTHFRQPHGEYRPGVAVVVPAYNEEKTILGTLRSLSAQDRPRCRYDKYIIVDNNSTDNTPEIVEKFRHTDSNGLRFTLLHESEKGTGAAADCGFRHAIELGYGLIARTDADTEPCPKWSSVIERSFHLNPKLQLMGGKTLGLHDEHYRTGDSLQYMIGVRIVFLARALESGCSEIISPVLGGNMAIRASAYQAVGGFNHTKIEYNDEDIELAIKIARHYGRGSIKNNSDMMVRSSMRRLRDLGTIGILLHHSFPNRRLSHPQNPDVR